MVVANESELVEHIYSAPLAPEGWLAAVRAMGAALDVPLGFFGTGNLAENRIFTEAGFGLSADDHALYREFLDVPRNPYLARLSRLPSSTMVFRLEELVSPRLLQETEIYDRIGRRYSVERGVAANVVVESATRRVLGALSFHGFAHGAASDEELAFLRRLMPHLGTAIRVTVALFEAEERARMACETLDRLRMPILLADASCRVRFANRAGRALLAARDGLRDESCLEALDPAETRDLGKLIHAAARAPLDGYSGTGGTLAVRRARESAPPLEVVVAPLPPDQPGDWPAGELAIVLASDPADGPQEASALLAQRFGLTPTETQLALALLDGTGVKEAADRLGVSFNTARCHLQHIFDKTGTRRQAELVRLLSSHPASWLAPSGRPGPGSP